MVNIQLDKKTVLTADAKQWIINIDNRAVSFHSSLGGALNCYLEKKLRVCGAESIESLIKIQNKLSTHLYSVLTPFKIESGTIKGGPKHGN